MKSKDTKSAQPSESNPETTVYKKKKLSCESHTEGLGRARGRMRTGAAAGAAAAFFFSSFSFLISAKASRARFEKSPPPTIAEDFVAWLQFVKMPPEILSKSYPFVSKIFKRFHPT